MNRPHISAELKRQIIGDAGHQCGYCHSDEILTGIPLSIEHIVPIVAGGLTIRMNLWLSCRPCNEIKATQTHAIDPETQENAMLFNPRTHSWNEHFGWSTDGTTIIGRTPIGRATVVALQLNRPLLVSARRRWVFVGWHPPVEDKE